MKLKRFFFKLTIVAIFSSLIVVIMMLMAVPAQADPYCKLIFKNRISHPTRVSISISSDSHGRVPLDTVDISPGGSSRIINVPCHIKLELHIADIRDGSIDSNPISISDFTTRCYVIRPHGITPVIPSLISLLERCPFPGVVESNCYKDVTFKNEASYIANAVVNYGFNGIGWEDETGNFARLETKKLSIPCNATQVSVSVGIPGSSVFLTKPYATPSEDCFILIGDINSAAAYKYKSCSERNLNISVKNHGAYIAELTVAYDYHGVRPSHHKDKIYAGKTGVITIPSDATNLHVKAKAVAGKIIFEVNLPRAQGLCTKVHGTTLFPKHEPCN